MDVCFVYLNAKIIKDEEIGMIFYHIRSIRLDYCIFCISIA